MPLMEELQVFCFWNWWRGQWIEYKIQLYICFANFILILGIFARIWAVLNVFECFATINAPDNAKVTKFLNVCIAATFYHTLLFIVIPENQLNWFMLKFRSCYLPHILENYELILQGMNVVNQWKNQVKNVYATKFNLRYRDYESWNYE